MSAPDAGRLQALAGRLGGIGGAVADSGVGVRTAMAAAVDGAAWLGAAAGSATTAAAARTADHARYAIAVQAAATSLGSLAAAVEEAPADPVVAAALVDGADALAAGRLRAAAEALRSLATASDAELAGGLVGAADARVLAALGLVDRSGLSLPRVVADLRSLAAAGDPVAVRAYLDSLSADQRNRLAHEDAPLVGSLEGAPPTMRYAANRVLLEQALATAIAGHQVGRAAHLRELLADPRRQFLLVDTRGDGRVEEVFGDLGAARHVTVFVPGITHTLDDFDDPGSTRDAARNLQRQAARLGRGAVATIAWLGYDTPGWGDSPLRAKALPAARALRCTVNGLLLRPGVTTTVVAHSYGSLVAGQALREGLQVSAVAVLGSPGMGAATVTGLHAAAGTRVFAARAPQDLVGLSENFGTDPADARFGATRIATGAGPGAPVGHSHYVTEDSESSRNLARISVGDYGAVTTQHDSPAQRLTRLPSTALDRAERPIERHLPEPARRLVHLHDRLLDPDLYADAGTDLADRVAEQMREHPPRPPLLLGTPIWW